VSCFGGVHDATSHNTGTLPKWDESSDNTHMQVE